MNIGSIADAAKILKLLEGKLKAVEVKVKDMDPKDLKGLQDLTKNIDPKALEKLKDLEKKQTDTEKWFMSAAAGTEQKLAARIGALEKQVADISTRLTALETKPLREMQAKQAEMSRMLSDLTKKYNETAKTVIQNMGR